MAACSCHVLCGLCFVCAMSSSVSCLNPAPYLPWFIFPTCSSSLPSYSAPIYYPVFSVLCQIGCVYTGRKKSDLLPISDTDWNLMHACKHKNPHKIQFFRIRSEPFPNVVLNQIHIRYLDIRLTSKHTYPILHRTPNARVTHLLKDF